MIQQARSLAEILASNYIEIQYWIRRYPVYTPFMQIATPSLLSLSTIRYHSMDMLTQQILWWIQLLRNIRHPKRLHETCTTCDRKVFTWTWQSPLLRQRSWGIPKLRYRYWNWPCLATGLLLYMTGNQYSRDAGMKLIRGLLPLSIILTPPSKIRTYKCTIILCDRQQTNNVGQPTERLRKQPNRQIPNQLPTLFVSDQGDAFRYDTCWQLTSIVCDCVPLVSKRIFHYTSTTATTAV